MKKKRVVISFSTKVLAVLFACVCMWGCGDTYYEWEKGRSSARVIGFINDSLVMVGDIRCWTKYEKSMLSISDEDLGSGCGHTRLCVYNYREQEDGPRWCDSLDYVRDNLTLVGQMSDSIVWGGDMQNFIGLWKIGEQSHAIHLSRQFDKCVSDFPVTSIKQWLGGTFIARGERSLDVGGDSCQYAILDTVSGMLTYKQLDNDLEWIKACDDVRAWGDDVYCVVLDREDGNSLVLKNKTETIPAPRKFAIGGFWGNMIKMSGNICSLKEDKIICSDVIWYGNELKFFVDDKVVVDLE